MSALSGKAGAVDGAAIVRNWNIGETADTQAYVASNTQCGTGRLPGNVDWAGAYDAYGHTPANMPGESFVFTGSVDGTNGATGTARVDSVVITCDIAAGGILSHVVNFSANGALTLGAAVAADATALIPPSAIGCKVALDTAIDTPSYVDETDVLNWTLTISAANVAYVSSSTAGQTKRNEGNIDATMSWAVLEGDPANLPAKNSIAGIRLFVDATTYWEILWGMFTDISDIQVDIETAAMVGATNNAAMNGIVSVSATDTIGSIKTPAAATFWPAA